MSQMPTFGRVLHVLQEFEVTVTRMQVFCSPQLEKSETYALDRQVNGKLHYSILTIVNKNDRATPHILAGLCRNLKLPANIFDLESTDTE
jgi:hypothetical protein